jgi:hypothetical protein
VERSAAGSAAGASATGVGAGLAGLKAAALAGVTALNKLSFCVGGRESYS